MTPSSFVTGLQVTSIQPTDDIHNLALYLYDPEQHKEILSPARRPMPQPNSTRLHEFDLEQDEYIAKVLIWSDEHGVHRLYFETNKNRGLGVGPHSEGEPDVEEFSREDPLVGFVFFGDNQVLNGIALVRYKCSTAEPRMLQASKVLVKSSCFKESEVYG